MWTEMNSPIGMLRLVGNGTAVTAIEFDGEEAGAMPASADRARARGDRRDRGDFSPGDPVLTAAERQLAEYFAGERTDFDLPLAPEGTPFQLEVWGELQGISYGETVTYGELAARLGRGPAASRAVGTANGANPIPIVIPCHRVVGADGNLVGYAGGLDRKVALLAVEGIHATNGRLDGDQLDLFATP